MIVEIYKGTRFSERWGPEMVDFYKACDCFSTSSGPRFVQWESTIGYVRLACDECDRPWEIAGPVDTKG